MAEHLHKIINDCINDNRVAQRVLFDVLKSKMFAVCMRYASSKEEAEDLLQEGFVKLFKDLHQYRFEGNFEGWARRVFVHNALQFLRKKRDFLVSTDNIGLYDNHTDEDELETFDEDMANMLINLLQMIPSGYRTILNLYVLEGFSHVKIAEELNISVGTSKSQLSRAKAHLKSLLEKKLTN